MHSYRLHDSLEYIWKRVRESNQYIEEQKPWELAKHDTAKFEAVMAKLLVDLDCIAHLIAPFLPTTSERMQQMLTERKGEILFQRMV